MLNFQVNGRRYGFPSSFFDEVELYCITDRVFRVGVCVGVLMSIMVLSYTTVGEQLTVPTATEQ
jgi:hypothetical protein